MEKILKIIKLVKSRKIIRSSLLRVEKQLFYGFIFPIVLTINVYIDIKEKIL